MKLTVFGNNATCPEANGACSSFLLTTEGKRILIDMGNGSLSKLQEAVDLKDLDCIIISHLHFDHFGDLFCAKYQLETRKAYGEHIPAIPLFVPQLPQWAEQEISTNGVFDIHTISDGASFDEASIRLKFIQVKHLIEAYGIRISSEGKTFAYSGDTGLCDSIQQVASRADMFLCEATFTGENAAEQAHHLSAVSAGKIAAKASAAKLLLTHYHSVQGSQLLAEAKSVYPNSVLTEIGKTYTV